MEAANDDMRCWYVEKDGEEEAPQEAAVAMVAAARVVARPMSFCCILDEKENYKIASKLHCWSLVTDLSFFFWTEILEENPRRISIKQINNNN